MRRKWTERERDYLRTHYRADGMAACAKALGRTPRSVFNAAWKLGLTGRQRTGEQRELFRGNGKQD